MDNQNIAKIAKYSCEHCCIKTNNKFDYEKHFLTRKHLKNVAKITANKGMDKETAIKPENIVNLAITSELNNSCSKTYVCPCGKKYLYSSGLSKHKKNCDANKKLKTQSYQNDNILNHELVMYLMKENKEFKEQLIELAKEGKVINNTTNNTTNTNNTNNNFNMNIFLNEKCANALNIMDFVNQMNLQLGDLESIGQLGYVNGISKIFVRELKELDVTKRPIHCSDLKREVMYIKNNDEWEKDNEERENMKKAIQYVSQKNMKQLKQWKEENPECMDSQSKKNVHFSKIMTNSCGATDEEDEKFFNKIIKNVAKEVVVEK